MKVIAQIANTTPSYTTTEVWKGVMLTVVVTGTISEIEWYAQKILDIGGMKEEG